MNAETVRDVLHRQPFEPFEVFTSSGERHEVRHPEFAIVSPGRLVIVDPVTDRLAILSLIHVTELRMLSPTPHGGGDGNASQP